MVQHTKINLYLHWWVPKELEMKTIHHSIQRPALHKGTYSLWRWKLLFVFSPFFFRLAQPRLLTLSHSKFAPSSAPLYLHIFPFTPWHFLHVYLRMQQPLRSILLPTISWRSFASSTKRLSYKSWGASFCIVLSCRCVGDTSFFQNLKHHTVLPTQ